MMRAPLLLGLSLTLLLAACTSTRQVDHEQVCAEQSTMAASGKVGGGAIAISCPAHNVGPFQ